VAERCIAKGIALPESYWEAIDKAAEQASQSRSGWFRAVVAATLSCGELEVAATQPEVAAPTRKFDPEVGF